MPEEISVSPLAALRTKIAKPAFAAQPQKNCLHKSTSMQDVPSTQNSTAACKLNSAAKSRNICLVTKGPATHAVDRLASQHRKL